MADIRWYLMVKYTTSQEIRKDLESIGINFNTEGDTEVLLKGFIEYGEGILEKLRGQFAFAIYDEAEGSVFLARDRVGIKPLYFSHIKIGLFLVLRLKQLKNLE